MAKPTRYYVDYEDADLLVKALKRVGGERDLMEPADFMTWEEFERIEDAHAFMRTCHDDGRFSVLRERRGLIDETPPGLPAWTFWDSNDETIGDCCLMADGG